MTKIDWVRKISSRKFWALIAGLVMSVMVLLGTPDTIQTQVLATIGAFSSIVVYMLAEAYVDANR